MTARLAEKLICTYSSKRAAKDRRDRQRQVDKAQKAVDTNQKSVLNHRGYKRFIKTGETEKDEQNLMLDEAKIATVPWGEQHIRISYANSYENLAMAMDALERVLVKWCGKKIED